MKSFSELNTYASTQLEHDDLRDYGVAFDRATATDFDYEPEELTSFVLPIGIEILEVINYQSADVRFQVDVSELIGASVSWTTLPSGSTLTVAQGVYTIDQINSRAIWNTIKQPTINLPVGYNGDEFSVYVKIIFNQASDDSATGEYTREYTVFANAVTADITTTADLTVDGKRFARITANLVGVFTPSIEVNLIPVETWQAPLATPFDYNPGAVQTLGSNYVPTLSTISGDADIVYTVTVTTNRPEILNYFAMQGGGAPVSFNYDSGTKTATFSGDRTDINYYISFFQIYIDLYNYWDFELNFNLTNDLNSNSEDYLISCISDNETFLAEDTADTYILNTATTIQGGPALDPQDYAPSGVHILTITPYDATQVSELDADTTVGTGAGSPTRILHSEVNRPVGNSVSMTTAGDRIFTGSNSEHRIYVLNGASWSQEASFDEADFSPYIWEPRLTDISEDGNRVIWWGYQGSVGSHTAQTIFIYSRSGSSWNSEAQLNATTPNYDNRIVGIKIDKDGNRFWYVTADGEIGIWSRSGTTWSEDYQLTGTFNRTVSGAGYSYDLVYDFLGMDISADGEWLSIGTEINFTDSDTPPDPADPEYNTVIAYYNDRAFIYNNNSLEEELIMSTAAEHLTVNTPGAVAVDDDGNVFAFGTTDGDDAVIFERIGSTTFSKVANLNLDSDSSFSLFGIDELALNAIGNKLAISGRTGTSTTPNNKPNVMLYLDTGSWSFQAEAGATNQTSTLTSVAYAADGDSIAYGNPSYTVSTNNKGEVVVYPIVDYGIFQTATKELTATGTPSQINGVLDGFSMTPATGETDTIDLIYEVDTPVASDPTYSNKTASRNHRITRTV